MFHHPDQLMTLNTSHLHELKAENDHWRLATKVMQAQPRAPKRPLGIPSPLRTLLNQAFHTLVRPAWETVVKPG